MADQARLESVCSARDRGFESHPLRQRTEPTNRGTNKPTATWFDGLLAVVVPQSKDPPTSGGSRFCLWRLLVRGALGGLLVTGLHLLLRLLLGLLPGL